MPRLLYLVTSPLSARFLLKGQLSYLRRHGFEVAIVSAPGEDLRMAAEREGVTSIPIPMERRIRPIRDLSSFFRLVWEMRRYSPDIVNASTPKAGLLGLVAARLTGVPTRVYTLRGLPLETTSGLKRMALGVAERVASACAHRVICISGSLQQTYVAHGFAPRQKTCVLRKGSSNGLDTERFRLDDGLRKRARALRSELKLPDGAPVVGYVGRFTRDKGIVELLRAFETLADSLPDLHLVLLGTFERGDPIPPVWERRLREHPRVVLAEWSPDPAPFYALMDVLAFPSHREGFGNVPLEAAACEVPVVGFRATGVVDSVADGVTGTLVPLGDVEALTRALRAYLLDEELRRTHGRAGRERAERDFQQEPLWEALAGEYQRLLRRTPLSGILMRVLARAPGR